MTEFNCVVNFDKLAPAVWGSVMNDGKERDRILELGRLCEKEHVSFTAVLRITMALSEWEDKYHD